MRQKTYRQRGFGLIMAVFLLVVLTGIAVAMADFSTMQRAAIGLDVQGVHAYQAARAGIEWGRYKALVINSPHACPASTSFVPAAPKLASFTVTVTCTSKETITDPDAIPPTSITVMRLTSTAVANVGTADEVRRVVQESFEAAPTARFLYRRELY